MSKLERELRKHTPNGINIKIYQSSPDVLISAAGAAARGAGQDPIRRLVPCLETLLRSKPKPSSAHNATVTSAAAEWQKQQQQHVQLGDGSWPIAAVGGHAVLDGSLAKVAQGRAALLTVVLLSQACNQQDQHDMFTCAKGRANAVELNGISSSGSGRSSSGVVLNGVPIGAWLAATCEYKGLSL